MRKAGRTKRSPSCSVNWCTGQTTDMMLCAGFQSLASMSLIVSPAPAKEGEGSLVRSAGLQRSWRLTVDQVAQQFLSPMQRFVCLYDALLRPRKRQSPRTTFLTVSLLAVLCAFVAVVISQRLPPTALFTAFQMAHFSCSMQINSCDSLPHIILV